MTIHTLFKREKNILIGMIHLSPLLSIQGYPGMHTLIDEALADLNALEKAGFDAVLIENEHDKPHTEYANQAQIASFTVVAQEICRRATIPVGVQVMLNDWIASCAIAKAVGATFTRLDVFVDDVICEWGEINPDPEKIITYKNSIYPELFLLTDIQVKYKTMVTPRPLVESAKLALKHSSDGLIITGEATGSETPLRKIKEVRDAYPSTPLFVGAGIAPQNSIEQLSVAHGAIVGTSIKTKGRIDYEKAYQLRKCVP